MALRKSQVAILTLRGLSLLFLLLSLIILITNKNTEADSKHYWKKLCSYSFMFGISVTGIGYTLLQTVTFVAFRIVMENDKGVLFEFYGDKAISYLLATAAAAGIGVSIDLKNYNNGHYKSRYFDMGFVSAGCLLLAFVCTASLSIMSSYALQKKL
ncbi:hypothetical protein ACB098_11G051500 [Castanea mollissima]